MKTFQEWSAEREGEGVVIEAIRPDVNRDKQFKVFIKELEKLYKKTGFAIKGEWFYDKPEDFDANLRYDTDPSSGDISF